MSEPTDKQGEAPTSATPTPLSRNLITFVGWIFCCVILALLLVLIATDLLFYGQDVYKDIITYMLLPGALSFGVALILLGVFLEWRRRHKRAPGEYPRLPVVDMNLGWQRRRLVIGSILLSVFMAVSTIIVYHSYHFTESPTFCGQVCHMVMEPEYVAYKHSPHSRVYCTECHIGPGADWFVKAKLSGLRQVWAVATNTYHTPIEVPVANLRPAQDTCEHCHWPEKFFNSIEKTIWHFSPDQANTPIRYSLLLKVGGGDPELGLGRGIHWHSSSKVAVRYWARDHKRLDIPYVEIQDGDNPPQAFRTEDCPDPLPEGAELRTMDCIDCHNRPSHVYRSPRQLIDSALGTGMLAGSLPYLKRYATELFEAEYETRAEALEAIDSTLREKYAKRMEGPKSTELVEKGIGWLQDVYSQNFFPEHGVDWREYPNHLGHFEFLGCNRCHDGQHLSQESETISNDCELCHDLIDQAEGEAAFAAAEYSRRPFDHPRNLGSVWEGHKCTDCHSLATSILDPNDTWWRLEALGEDREAETSAGDAATTATPTPAAAEDSGI